MILLRRIKELTNKKTSLDLYSKKFLSSSTSVHHDNGIGLLFDIDGVILRGKTLIPAAKLAMERLTDGNGKFIVPTVFVTNAGNCLSKTKADQLSKVLDMDIHVDQVMLSHSPLRMFPEYHNKCVLLSGQGPIEEIASRIGFSNTITINDIRAAYPFLDKVDHKPRPAKSSRYTATSLPNIDAIVLMGEPTRWETNLQLIIDILMTNGSLQHNDMCGYGEQRVPVLACNMDLQWMSDISMPRFGHGMFLHCLESVYLKLVGRPLLYSALVGKPSISTYQYAERLVTHQAEKIGLKNPIRTLYAIGDNPMADIYGANLYNRSLQQRKKDVTFKSSVTEECPKKLLTSFHEAGLEQPRRSFVEKCHSVLVCTGVYAPGNEKSSYTKPPVFHGPRDIEVNMDLSIPDVIALDVNRAVEAITEREKTKNSIIF